MANSNSPLIARICRIAKKCYQSLLNKKNKKITIHHAAGSGSAESAVALWERRGSVSTNYYDEKDGTIVLIVDEKDRSYASCNRANDSQAVTIEVANCKGAPYWEVSDKSVKALINLCVDICKRNGMPGLTWTGDSKGTLTCHYMFKATACPGPYLTTLMPWIASEVTARVNGLKSGEIIIPKVDFSKSKTSTTKATTTNKNNTPAATPTKVTSPYMYNGVDLAPVFNSTFYSDYYPDLKKAYGYDASGLFYHFCTCGMKEGRKGNSEFDPWYYRRTNADVEALYEDNMKGYYAHYCIHGKGEGRKGV